MMVNVIMGAGRDLFSDLSLCAEECEPPHRNIKSRSLLDHDLSGFFLRRLEKWGGGHPDPDAQNLILAKLWLIWESLTPK